MRSCITLLVFFFCSYAFAGASDCIIRGRVYDATTKESLPGVNIIYGINKGTTSDSEGKFVLRVSPGRTVVTFRFVGYSPLTKTFNLSANDTVDIDILLNPLVNEINEIVITAGRSEQRISELTVSMDIIKPHVINQNHSINAAEIINKTSGIEILDGQASVRGGSGYSYGAGSRVLALVDGLPILSTDAGNIKWSSLPMENIAQIEVIKGASSVLYGSSALNGVINFITAEPGPEPLTRFSLVAGIYDKPANKDWVWWDTPRMTQSVSITHSGKYDNTKISAGARLSNDKGYRKLNDEALGRINLNLKHAGGKYKSLTLGAAINATYINKTDFLLWEDAESGALKQDQSTAMAFRGSSMALDPFISINKNKRIKHDLKLRLLGNINKLPQNSNNNSNSYSVFSEYQFSFTASEKFKLISGVSQQYSLINSNFHGDHKGQNIAAYSQLDIRPYERLKIITGVRLEQNFLDSQADKVVPVMRLGMNVKIREATFLRASYGGGYRYPSIAEKHAYTTVGSIKIIPNSEIRPESGWSSEIGIKHAISAGTVSGHADISLFYSQNRDMIEYVFGWYEDPVTETYSYGFRPVNIENSRVYGAEFEFMLNRNFGAFNTTMRGGYTFMYPVEFNGISGRNTDTYLKFRRKHSSQLSVSTIYQRFETGVSCYLKSRILAIDDVFVNPLTREDLLPGFFDWWTENNKGHFLLDMHAKYRFNTMYDLSISVKNLTNTEYMGRPGDIRPQRYYSLQFGARF
ncbi:MAG: TonB-dependent receptor [Bacteroidales bacterium]|jgi:iron complex outermembrane receptor protein|nr:TonB-dependent receptor [Bacteroidales bacterium]